MSVLHQLRSEYHRRICGEILGMKDGIFNNADRDSMTSRQIAEGIARQLPYPFCLHPPSGQTAGKRFEEITAWFLQETFQHLFHLRPGKWGFFISGINMPPGGITRFEQYEHLDFLTQITGKYKDLMAALGTEYVVMPDILIGRYALEDAEVDQREPLLGNMGNSLALHTPLRQQNRSLNHLILHATVSCKWTIRSDRSQNTRTEALNLIRNRKGHTPHIVAVTAEPMPTRIASLALGTGDIDCVYHFALPELIVALQELGNADQQDMLGTLLSGRRLRDIADLPFDLAI